MDSYVVHIYRQGHSPKNFVGTAEKVGQDSKKAFTSVEELWGILTDGKRAKNKIMISHRDTEAQRRKKD